MAVLTVRKYGDPLLRRRAAPVREITPEIRRIVDDMIDTMYDEVGVGLAAPQVGISLRLMVVGDDNGHEARALVNPAISEHGGEVTAEEGCLSLPGIFAPVTRAEWVKLEAQDLHGKPVSIRARGLTARVLQHEMDHLDGVLITQRMTAAEQKFFSRRLKELEAEFAETAGRRR